MQEQNEEYVLPERICGMETDKFINLAVEQQLFVIYQYYQALKEYSNKN